VAGLGLIEVSVGPWTANVTELVVPAGVTTVTFLFPVPAVVVITMFAVTVVAVGVPVMVAVAPEPDTVTPVAPVRRLPVSVTGTVVPRTPDVGLIDARIGPMENDNVFVFTEVAPFCTATPML
jgi:hypothetical protein